MTVFKKTRGLLFGLLKMRHGALSNGSHMYCHKIIFYLHLLLWSITCQQLQKKLINFDIYFVTVWVALIPASTSPSCVFLFFSFFFFWVQLTIVDFVNCEQYIYALFTVPQITFFNIFLLKMGPTVLFTYLKIISLQYFQFQFSVSAKISSIQTHP